ncbi:swarming motility protein [Acrasis kona]|uniref:Swarming motility protein n=1 Tax=Acrasis kona TaxID=1008807 RepID=A0AAW2YHB9_9EUKA
MNERLNKTLNPPIAEIYIPTHSHTIVQSTFPLILPFYSHNKDTPTELNADFGRYWNEKGVDSRIFSNLYPAPIRVPFLRVVEDGYVDEERIMCDELGYELWLSNEHYFQSSKYGPGDRIFMRDLTTGQVAQYGQKRLKMENKYIKKINELKESGKPYPVKKDGLEYQKGDVSEPVIKLPGGSEQWNKEKIRIMYMAIRAKFSDQHPSLKEQLLATGNAWLIEHTKNDKQWGDGVDGTGSNYLGKLLMYRREELRSDVDEEEWLKLVTQDKDTLSFYKHPMNQFVKYNPLVVEG